MFALALQSALMLAIAFIAGCFIGHFARGLTISGNLEGHAKPQNKQTAD